MRLMKGDMWESGADVIVVTGNATVRGDGALVMGRGAAREAATRYPYLPAHFGRMIRDWDVSRPYGVLISWRKEATIAIFQVKVGWWEKAKVELIENSVSVLSALAGIKPGVRYALNFPGIGNGRLKREAVLPIVSRLPDNVEVWER